MYTQDIIYEPHNNHKPNIYNRYTKNRKEYKHNNKESHQLTQGESKRRKEQRRSTETTREQQNSNKYIPINYFKCKWSKCLNQKTGD